MRDVKGETDLLSVWYVAFILMTLFMLKDYHNKKSANIKTAHRSYNMQGRLCREKVALSSLVRHYESAMICGIAGRFVAKVRCNVLNLPTKGCGYFKLVVSENNNGKLPLFFYMFVSSIAHNWRLFEFIVSLPTVFFWGGHIPLRDGPDYKPVVVIIRLK